MLGRPLLFEIAELDRPEPDVVYRWIVSFSIADAARLIFELKESSERLPAGFHAEGSCYELLENGAPCEFCRWHFGPDTARNTIVAIVEGYVQRNLRLRPARQFLERAGSVNPRYTTTSLCSLSSFGQEILNLFRPH
ncbi:hypothetical protein [Microvirga roseola]|uniref:hypothetical protein n=1 Tax=Microvirga roseola TaxID=2883126 RepID=UPI001E357BD0|nr:hypothetical protein [Microvirga roseola]